MKTKLGVEWRSLKNVNGKCTNYICGTYILILSFLATIYKYIPSMARQDMTPKTMATLRHDPSTRLLTTLICF